MSNSNPLPSSFDGNTEFYEENRLQKLTRRLKEEPLIPVGCILTCAALLGASRSIRAGDHNRTNRMFRARIAAQAFTLVAMVAGSIYWDSDRKKRKEFEGLVEERKRREKNEAWIRELEARDEEEKEIRAQRERRRARAEGRTVKESVKGKVEDVVEKTEEKGQGVLGSIYGLVGGGKSSPEKEQKPETETKPPKEAASSMIDGSEIRRLGVLEMVQELVNYRRN